jgi:Flp pilus assembly protein TadD
MVCDVRRWWAVWLVCTLAGCGGGETTALLKKFDVRSRLDVASAAAAAGVGSVATNMLAEAARAAPDNAEVQQRYIRALVDSGRFSEAGQALAKVVQRLPGNLVLRYEVARLDILQGMPQKALGSLEQIVRLEPENVPAWCAEGVAFELLGNSVAADQAYDRAASLAPYDKIVANDRAVSLLLRGKPEAAAKLLRGVMEQTAPNSRIIGNLALADRLTGNANGVADLLGNRSATEKILESTQLIGPAQESASASTSGANDAAPQNGCRLTLPSPFRRRSAANLAPGEDADSCHDRVSPRKSRSPLRPGPGGGALPSLG